MTDSETIARACAAAAADKKAEAIVLLDLKGVSGFTDFFLICSGTSEPQLKAISSAMREKVREDCGTRPLAEDGYPASQWVVLDFGGVICHIFHEDKRKFYDLESLWSDARRLPVAEIPPR
ncbi:MAG: ribosome silencing factor [Verrucomicrobiae bacterium]